MRVASKQYERDRFVFKPVRIMRITRNAAKAACKKRGLTKTMTLNPAPLAMIHVLVEERLDRFFTLAACVLDQYGDHRTLSPKLFRKVRELERRSRPNAPALKMQWVVRDAARCAREAKKAGGAGAKDAVADALDAMDAADEDEEEEEEQEEEQEEEEDEAAASGLEAAESE